jgi:hypothetical protein
MKSSLKTQSNKPEWLVVYTTYHFYEAHIVAGRLQSEGIPVMVHQQAGANAMGIHIGGLGEIHVLVDPANYEWAVAVLDSDSHAELPEDVDQIIYGDDDDE